MSSRREFLKSTIIMLFLSLFNFNINSSSQKKAKKTGTDIKGQIYRCVNGTPSENMKKVIELLGGIEKIIDKNDIVIIKPNVQWWNQGVPNLSALKTLVDIIMQRSGGFTGEVILAENSHRGPKPWESENSGWAAKFERNSDINGIINYNELCSLLKKDYGNNLTVSHWLDVDFEAKRIYHPCEGAGYVYCDGTKGVPLIEFNNSSTGGNYRSVIMTYPIFKTDKGTIVDFKNGVWDKGKYTKQPVKFINFPALNHHSDYCGVTSAVKNYLGITDLSGGSDPDNNGKLTANYYNFHSFAFNKWSPGPKSGMLGGEVACFMNKIRKADLNIVSAEWIGIISRTDLPAARTKAILASTDPVALDYHSCKYILYYNSHIPVHDVSNKKSPVYQYLKECSNYGVGQIDEEFIKVISYDHKAGRTQREDELFINGEMFWNKNLKNLLKYLYFRYINLI
ncbi:MAG: DUF362 domain-containing protein [Spirochaetes bacterium]|nr:DUF362 domain-containing protein [Spirochaetota bacterium]